MTDWTQKILDAFARRYCAAAAAAGVSPDCTAAEAAALDPLRIRASSACRPAESARPPERAAFSAAAQALEKRRLIQLVWTKRGGESRITALICKDTEKLFAASGAEHPAARRRATAAILSIPRHRYAAFLRFIAGHAGCSALGRVIDEDAARGLLLILDNLHSAAAATPRALSVRLFSDSKRLEHLLALFLPFACRAEGIPVPPLPRLARSFSETTIAGRVLFEYRAGARISPPPLVNGTGGTLGLPLSSVLAIARVRPLRREPRPSVLVIENKETFFALAGPQSAFPAMAHTCYIYSCGFPGEAAAAMLRLLAVSGFRFYHSGDLDPSGILILQKVADTVRGAARGVPVTPVRMNAAVFDRYLPHGYRLTAAMLRGAGRIRGDTRSLPGIAPLLERIIATRRGIEQEIIDYT